MNAFSVKENYSYTTSISLMFYFILVNSVKHVIFALKASNLYPIVTSVIAWQY